MVLLSVPDSIMNEVGNIYAIDDSETTISEWTQFLAESQSDNVTQLRKINADFDSYLKDIYHPQKKELVISKSSLYGSIPITNISYHEALEFCKWRTRQDSLFSVKNGNQYYNYYRLPSKILYNWLISISIFDYSQIDDGCPGFNLKSTYPNDHPDCTYFNKKTEYNQLFKKRLGKNSVMIGYTSSNNRFNIYDILGNVSEMTNEIWVSKGGGFTHKIDECNKGQNIPYSSIQPWLGFRCVAEIRKI